jgi:hypothetical protein
MVHRAIPARNSREKDHVCSACLQHFRGVRTHERRKNGTLSSDQMWRAPRSKTRYAYFNPP